MEHTSEQEHQHEIHPLPGPIRLIKDALRLYRDKFPIFASLGLIVFTVSLIQLFSIASHSIVLFIFSVIASIIVSYVIYLALIRAAADPARVTVGEVLTGVEHAIIPALGVSVLMIFISIGSVMLLIIPAMITGVYLMFALFAVIVDHYRGYDALVYSWHLVLGKWWRTLWRVIVANIIISLCYLLVLVVLWKLGIGETPSETIMRAERGDNSMSVSQSVVNEALSNFVLLPITLSFMYVLYEALKKATTRKPSHEESEKIKNTLKILMIIGIAGVITAFFISSILIVKYLPDIVRITHMPASVLTAF